MTYPELKQLLEKEGIVTGACTGWSGFETHFLFIRDTALLLFPLKERIENILLKEEINATVTVFTNHEELHIKLINNGEYKTIQG